MDPNTSRIKDLAVGDLVTHALYGKEWIGMILGFKDEGTPPGPRTEKALVQIQPGTKYESFFRDRVSTKDRITENLGYVTTNWLFKLGLKNGNSRSTRRKAL